MKTILLLLTILVSLTVSGSALADSISVVPAGSDQLVRLNGAWGGAAAEIYAILDLAGVQPSSRTEGRDLVGTDVIASLQRFTPFAYFGATIRIGATSGMTVSPEGADTGASVVVTGDAAEELFQDMQKAGVPRHSGVDTAELVGTHVSCLLVVSGHSHYSCSLRAS